MSKGTWNVALLQMHIEIGEPDHNYERLTRMLQAAVASTPKPDVIVFPELWNTGYALDRIQELSDPAGERTKEMLSTIARQHQVNLVAGSVAAREGKEVRNTTFAFDRNGDVALEYSKIHLFRLMDEEKYLHSGETVGLLELDGHKAGSMICYDIRFPELARRLALSGAGILFVPAEWPNPRLHHWRTLLTARAIENQMYVIACNRVGTSGDTTFFGHSMVIDPWGDILAEGGEEEAILTATLNLEQVEQVRAKIPVFEDRRPELY